MLPQVPADPRKFKTAFIFADRPMELNTSVYRCFMPAKALVQAAYGVALIPAELFEKHDQNVENILSQANIIVAERNYFGDIITRLVYWKVRGKVIILNWDDGYHAMEETNVSYHFWKLGLIEFKMIKEMKIG